MNAKPGQTVETAGIYWCTVCKTPAVFEQGKTFPGCPNLCGKGHWQFIKAAEAPKP
jgi:hypothetical protein